MAGKIMSVNDKLFPEPDVTHDSLKSQRIFAQFSSVDLEISGTLQLCKRKKNDEFSCFSAQKSFPASEPSITIIKTLF